MTQARPNGASTGRHLLTSSSILSQDEQSSGRNILTAKRTASTNVASPGAAWAVPAAPGGV